MFVGILKNTDEKRDLSIDTTWVNTSKLDLRPREKWQEVGVGTNLDFYVKTVPNNLDARVQSEKERRKERLKVKYFIIIIVIPLCAGLTWLRWRMVTPRS